MNLAVRHAVELEAFNKAEKKHLEGQGYMRVVNQPESHASPSTGFASTSSDLRESKDVILNMQKTLEALSRQNKPTNNSNNNVQKQIPCSSGYVRRSGPFQQKEKRKCFTCGSEEHLRRNCPKNKNKPLHDNSDSETKGKVNLSNSHGSGL